HRIADMTYFIGGKRWMRRHLHWRAVLGVDHPPADQIADLVCRKLFAGEHVDDAWHCLGRRHINALDLRVGVRGADERRPGGPRAERRNRLPVPPLKKTGVFLSGAPPRQSPPRPWRSPLVNFLDATQRLDVRRFCASLSLPPLLL